MKEGMRKYILFVLMAMLLLCSACTPSMFYFRYDHSRDRVVKIELIEYDDPDIEKRPFRFFENKKDDRDFQQEYCAVIETLSPEYHEEFLSKFFETQIFHEEFISDSPSGQGIRITCEDGSFTVFTWGYVDGKALGHASCYDKKGKWQDMQTGFESLRSEALFVTAQYFETKIEIIQY